MPKFYQKPIILGKVPNKYLKSQLFWGTVDTCWNVLEICLHIFVFNSLMEVFGHMNCILSIHQFIILLWNV